MQFDRSVIDAETDPKKTSEAECLLSVTRETGVSYKITLISCSNSVK